MRSRDIHRNKSFKKKQQWVWLFIFLLIPSPSVTPRFSESLSVNHLSFRFWFLGLFSNAPKANLEGFFESQVFSESRSRFFCFLFFLKKLFWSSFSSKILGGFYFFIFFRLFFCVFESAWRVIFVPSRLFFSAIGVEEVEYFKPLWSFFVEEFLFFFSCFIVFCFPNPVL